MASTLLPYDISLDADLTRALRENNANPQAAYNNLLDSLRSFIDSFHSDYGVLPSSGDYLRLASGERYIIKAREFVQVVAGQGNATRFTIHIAQVG